MQCDEKSYLNFDIMMRLRGRLVGLFDLVYHLPYFHSLNWPAYSTSCILGIETSCDDTCAAIIDSSGNLKAEEVISQTCLSTMLGGVLPTVARERHEQTIHSVVSSVLNKCRSWRDIDAIAVTVKPGMPLSLKVGVAYAKELAKYYNKPIIPIHHMEAHALISMFTHPNLQFPFLALLVSGGHGLLALVRDLEDFLLLGTSLDAPPGDVLDKLARRLKLFRLGDPRLKAASGGRAIELLASDLTAAHPLFTITHPRSQDRDCDFSFSGIHLAAEHTIELLERDITPSSDPHISSGLSLECTIGLCASIQYTMTQVICHRVQRAFEFLRLQTSSIFPWPNALIVSGGVAANSFIRNGLAEVSAHYHVPLLAPPERLCTDNGVMIAWNGLLLRRAGSRIFTDPSLVDFVPNASFGVDCRAMVREADIKIRPIKLSHSPINHTITALTGA